MRLHAGDPLPPADACDAAVVLGSEQTAYDDAVPWLAAELAFVDACWPAEVPVLGICFGAQVLARVLGARLYRLAEPEIGWVRVTSKHPGLAEGPWPSWHRDAFDLPAGATELAVNEVCLQAFAIGPHAAVQFHPEATQPIVASWLANANPPPGQEVDRPVVQGRGQRLAAGVRQRRDLLLGLARRRPDQAVGRAAAAAPSTGCPPPAPLTRATCARRR